ncbi:MAG: signal peptidase II [Proteobacteria bacterium]|nr:signal peptidase II [Pseudomonadota bacterium]MBI3495745.1 signal peptidase II [Pseudomonadota bacterium]
MAIGLALALAVVGLDQLVKSWLLGLIFFPPQQIVVTAFFNLTPVWNRGVTFGLLSQGHPAGPWAFSALALVVVGVLLVWLVRARDWLLILAIPLVIGGAIGNVIDRTRFGAVADFLDFHALGWHFWVFNLADAAITVGAALLILHALFQRSPESDK